jgi:hypothetical protein
LGSDWGSFYITATIANGSGQGVNYTKDFWVKVNQYNKTTNTVYFTHHGEASWGQHWSTELTVKDFYSSQLKANTDYEITIRGNLNTPLQNVTAELYVNPSAGFIQMSSLYSAGNVNSGSFNETFTIHTNNDGNFLLYRDQAILQFTSNSSSSILPSSELGKVKATITNFSMTIREASAYSFYSIGADYD